MGEWGNYGPLEVYVVGTNKKAAAALEEKFCLRHLRLDSNWQRDIDCPADDYPVFMQYVGEALASGAVSEYMVDYLDYNFFTLALGTEFPLPEDEDFGRLVLHEYFHVFQHAQLNDYCDGEGPCSREEKMVINPWFSEGSAEYMATLLYSRQSEAKSDDLQTTMHCLLFCEDEFLATYLESGISLQDIPYNHEVDSYSIGAWFFAYLIHNEGEDALIQGFYGDLNDLGFEPAFTKHFGRSSEQYITQFNQFIKQPWPELVKILPIKN